MAKDRKLGPAKRGGSCSDLASAQAAPAPTPSLCDSFQTFSGPAGLSVHLLCLFLKNSGEGGGGWEDDGP